MTTAIGNQDRFRIFLCTACVLALTVSVLATGQSKQLRTGAGTARMMLKTEYPFAPVTLTDVKVNENSVRFGEAIEEEANWLHGLSLSVKNVSDSDITYVSVDLRVDPPESGDLPRITSFARGVLPFAAPDEESARRALMTPGESLNITLSNEEYRKYADYFNVRKVKVSIGRVFFADSSLWMGGVLYTRDPNIPTRWNPIESSVRRLERFYQERRKERSSDVEPVTNDPPLTSLSTKVKPVAYKITPKTSLQPQLAACFRLTSVDWFQCDYGCSSFAYSYLPPFESGFYEFYQGYANCPGAGGEYCYPYQTVTLTRLCGSGEDGGDGPGEILVKWDL